MTALGVWLSRLKGTLFPARRDAELEQELRFHIELAAEAAQRQHVDADGRKTAVRLGGLTQSMDALRDQRGLRWLEDTLRDFAVSLRTLKRPPTFSTVAILTLGLTVGAATTISSVVDTILLQPLPYAHGDRLVRVVENIPTARGGVVTGGPTFAQFLTWRQRATTLDDALAAYGPVQRTLRIGSETVRGLSGSLSANAFEMLGLRPLLGRTFQPADETNGDVAILSFEAWQRFYRGDPQAIGSTFELQASDVMFSTAVNAGNRTMTVVGVLPRDVELPTVSADFYTPLLSSATPSPTVRMIGRRRADVSVVAARDEANVIGPEVKPPRPNPLTPLRGPRFDVQDLKEQVVARLQPALRVLLVAVALLLVIGGANIANLLLARGSARHREMATRLALGASVGRLVRLVLSECVLLAIAGGALGALIAAAGLLLVRRLATLDAPGIFQLVWGQSLLPRGTEVGIDLRLFGMAFALALATSVIAGTLSAWQTSRAALASSLNARGGWSTTRRALTRHSLAVAQVALATVLLVGAALLARSFMALTRVENGFDPRQVLTFQLIFPGGYPLPRKTEAIDAVLTRLRATPGIAAAGMTRAGILLPEEIVVGTFVPPGKTVADMEADPATRPRLRPVTGGYLTAMSVPILSGREFEAADASSPAPLLVISQSVATHFFGSGRAVGETINWHMDKIDVPAQVIGVVADVHNESPDREAGPDVFVEYHQLLRLLERFGESAPRQEQTALGFLSFAVRTRDNPAAAGSSVVDAVRAVDNTIGVDAMIPMTRLAASAVARQRFGAVLLSIFAGVAVALAAIGVYGVLAYDVIRRTRDIGVRMALGAQRRAVLKLVLKQGLALVGVGVAVGAVVASTTTTLMQSLLFGIAALDPQSFIAAALLFGLVAALASYIPARRATHVQPMDALRSE